MDPIHTLTGRQISHLDMLTVQFVAMLREKYIKGAGEHGGFVGDNDTRVLLNMAIEETVDQYVYLMTALEKLVSDRLYDPPMDPRITYTKERWYVHVLRTGSVDGLRKAIAALHRDAVEATEWLDAQMLGGQGSAPTQGPSGNGGITAQYDITKERNPFARESEVLKDLNAERAAQQKVDKGRDR